MAARNRHPQKEIRRELGGMTGSSCFPSRDEQTAAAALVLLQSFSKPPSPRQVSSDTSSCFSGEISFGCGSSSKAESSCCSSCVSDSSSAAAGLDCQGQGQCDPLRLLAIAGCCSGIKRKVARKARSKIPHGDNKKQRNLLWYGWRIKKVDEVVSPHDIKEREVEHDAVSCISSTAGYNSVAKINSDSCRRGASSLSSSPHGSSSCCRVIRSGAKVKERIAVEDGNQVVCRGSCRIENIAGSNGMRRKARDIMKLLCAKGCDSEVGIRGAIGDSPDTSKALRRLLQLAVVERSGGGGRADPFLYRVAGKWTEFDPAG